MKDELRKARDAILREQKQKSIHEHAVKHVYRAVHATWSVEKKSVTDNVLKVVRDVVVNARTHWIRTLLSEKSIVDSATEDDDVSVKRQACVDCVARMKRVLNEIDVIEQNVA